MYRRRVRGHSWPDSTHGRKRSPPASPLPRHHPHVLPSAPNGNQRNG
nr:MAG TPA: hypothetical protein [Caudoviricetes sp.]